MLSLALALVVVHVLVHVVEDVGFVVASAVAWVGVTDGDAARSGAWRSTQATVLVLGTLKTALGSRRASMPPQVPVVVAAPSGDGRWMRRTALLVALLVAVVSPRAAP